MRERARNGQRGIRRIRRECVRVRQRKTPVRAPCRFVMPNTVSFLTCMRCIRLRMRQVRYIAPIWPWNAPKFKVRTCLVVCGVLLVVVLSVCALGDGLMRAVHRRQPSPTEAKLLLLPQSHLLPTLTCTKRHHSPLTGAHSHRHAESRALQSTIRASFLNSQRLGMNQLTSAGMRRRSGLNARYAAVPCGRCKCVFGPAS